MSGKIEGDSITFILPEHSWFPFVFKRGVAPETPRNGLFVLSAVNGRRDEFVVLDVVVDGKRTRRTIVYDSIVFIDQVFYRFHRREYEIVTDSAGRSVTSSERTIPGYGAYDSGPGFVALRAYFLSPVFIAHDTLTASSDVFIRDREVDGSDIPLVERYERR